jgi:hypothetical protein
MPRARTTLAAVLLTASAAYLAVRFLPAVIRDKPAHFTLDPDQRQRFNDAQARYAAYPAAALTDSATIKQVLAVLNSGPEQPLPPATALIPATLTPDQARKHRADLNRLMAEFVLYAIVKQDADAYIGWREGRGDRLITRDKLERYYMVNDAWTELTGSPPPDNLSSRDVFRFFHDKARSETPADRRVTGIVNHPDAVFTQLWFDNYHLFTTVEFPEPLGESGWTGSQVAGGRGYFVGTTAPDDLYAAAEPVLRARCGIILVNERGTRQPLMLHAFRSPADGSWNIDLVHLGNIDPEAMPGLTW